MKKQEESRLQRGQHILTFAKDKEAGWASRKPKEIHAQALHSQSLENQNFLEVVRSNTLKEKAMLVIVPPIRNGGNRDRMFHEDKKPKPKTPSESLRIRAKTEGKVKINK